jgi:predicted  nucleic acid-binding Zn-ribbon protein
MNGYQAMMEIVQIDGKMSMLANKLNKVTNTKEREALEKQINTLDVRFIELKHGLQDTEINIKGSL